MVLGEAVHKVVERALLRLYFRVLHLTQSFGKLVFQCSSLGFCFILLFAFFDPSIGVISS